MAQSATLGRRERRKQETASALTAVSRRLTAQVGFGGFTIEDVCREVDVSRSTFFNYFPSKEDAVIGVGSEDESRRFADDFVARGSGDWSKVIEDLVELVGVHFGGDGIDRAGHSDFRRALEREPRLMARFIGISRERDRQAAALIAERESVAPDDPRAEAAVSIVSSLLRSAREQLVHPDNKRDFSTILNDSLTLFRSLLVGVPSHGAAA
jgi:AcrR family transcriptional regulator